MGTEQDENPKPKLSTEEKGQLLYKFAVSQSNLSYFQRHVGRHVRYAWTQISNIVGDFGFLGLRLVSNVGTVGNLLKNEITELLVEIHDLPQTLVLMWEKGDFLLPLHNLREHLSYMAGVQNEFNKEWNYAMRNARRMYHLPWSGRSKFYIGFVTLLSVFTLYHYKLRPWPKHTVKTELGCLHRTVVITGSSSGIGYRLAYEFLKRGAFVILTSPDMVNARKARLDLSRKLLRYVEKQKRRFMDQAQVRYYDQIELPYHIDIDFLLQNVIEVELNLASTGSIYSFCRKLQGMSPNGIDILVNNAAIKVPPEEMVVTDEGKEAHFAVNYFGHFLLTNLLLSLLAKRKGARIINVTCRQGVERGFIKMKEFIDPYLQEDGLPFLPAQDGYANSKLAMYLFNRQLAKELEIAEIYNVTTYSVCPGATRTFLDRYTTFNSRFSELFYCLTSGFYKKQFHGVQPILHCALSPLCASESGLFYENNERVIIKTRHRNVDTIAKALWDTSQKLMAVGHLPMLKLTEQMHVLSHENIFQLAKDLFLNRRDVMTHLLLVEEKQAFETRHKMLQDDYADARNDFTYFWNGFYLSGGENSSLVERWVLINTHPGFRALQQEYDVWFECTGSAHFHPESNGKMAALQYMASMAAPLCPGDIAELEKVYESDSEPDDEVEDEDRYYSDYISIDEFL